MLLKMPSFCSDIFEFMTKSRLSLRTGFATPTRSCETLDFHWSTCTPVIRQWSVRIKVTRDSSENISLGARPENSHCPVHNLLPSLARRLFKPTRDVVTQQSQLTPREDNNLLVVNFQPLRSSLAFASFVRICSSFVVTTR